MEAVREIVAFFAANLVVFLGLGIGLSIDPRLLRKFPAGLAFRAVIVAAVAVPLFDYAVARMMPISPALAATIMIFALSPGAPFLLLDVRKAKLEAPQALWLVLILSATACVLAPAGLALLSALRPGKIPLGPFDALRALAPLAIALAVGLGIHAASPRLALRLRPAVLLLFKAALLVVLPIALLVGGKALLQADLASILSVALVTVGAALLGHAAGRTPEERRLLGRAMVYGNPAIALAVASKVPDVPLVPIVIAYILVRMVAALPYARFTRAWSARRVEA